MKANEIIKKIALINLFFVFISNTNAKNIDFIIKGITCRDSNGCCYLLNEKKIYFVDEEWPQESLWKMVHIKADTNQENIKSLKILTQVDLKEAIVYKNMLFSGIILYNENLKGGNPSLEISFGPRKKIKIFINIPYPEILKYKNKLLHLKATVTVLPAQKKIDSGLLIQQPNNLHNKPFVGLSNCVIYQKD